MTDDQIQPRRRRRSSISERIQRVLHVDRSDKVRHTFILTRILSSQNGRNGRVSLQEMIRRGFSSASRRKSNLEMARAFIWQRQLPVTTLQPAILYKMRPCPAHRHTPHKALVCHRHIHLAQARRFDQRICPRRTQRSPNTRMRSAPHLPGRKPLAKKGARPSD
jgi:hypothetical protein